MTNTYLIRWSGDAWLVWYVNEDGRKSLRGPYWGELAELLPRLDGNLWQPAAVIIMGR